MTANAKNSDSLTNRQKQVDDMLAKLAEDGDFDIEIPDDPPPEKREGLENLEFHKGWFDKNGEFSSD